MKGRLAYLCLSSTQEAQASHAHVHEIINGLRARGWSVTLFSPDWAGDAPQRRGILRRAVDMLLVQARLLFRLRKFEVVYVRGHFGAFPLACICRILRCPIVQEVNGPYADLFIAWPWTRLFSALFIWAMRLQMRWADRVIAVTEGLKEWVRGETGRTDVDVVPNGANVTMFSPDAPLNVSLPPGAYAVFFGALAKWQGLDSLLSAAASERWPTNVRLVIAGEGELKGQVLLAEQRFPDRIAYVGRVRYQDVPGLIARSVAAFIPKNDLGGRSTTGLSPLKLYETLACGVPVIVTDFPGQADLVRQHSAGLVVPPGDIGRLAEALDQLWKRPDLRAAMGRAGREAVVSQHSWKRRAETTECSIQLAIRHRGSRTPEG